MDSLQLGVSEVVKQLRTERHVSQQQLADSLNVTRTSVSNIEHGRQALTLNMFCKIAVALDKNPVDLLQDVLTYRPSAKVLAKDVSDPQIRKLMNETISS